MTASELDAFYKIVVAKSVMVIWFTLIPKGHQVIRLMSSGVLI